MLSINQSYSRQQQTSIPQHTDVFYLFFQQKLKINYFLVSLFRTRIHFKRCKNLFSCILYILISIKYIKILTQMLLLLQIMFQSMNSRMNFTDITKCKIIQKVVLIWTKYLLSKIFHSHIHAYTFIVMSNFPLSTWTLVIYCTNCILEIL